MLCFTLFMVGLVAWAGKTAIDIWRGRSDCGDE